ncbi:MAG: 50S ribosomal protein L29 [Deltaproteobacteria bacterium]
MSTDTELRLLNAEELEARVAELKHQIFEMRGKLNTGVLDSTADLAKTRRLVARCRTLAREKELGIVRSATTETRKGKKE